jgi:hypothetical protein
VLKGTIRPPFGVPAEIGEHPLELADIARVDRLQLHPQRRCRGLHGGELADAGDRRLTQYRHAFHAWRDLLEQLQPLGANAVRASAALSEGVVTFSIIAMMSLRAAAASARLHATLEYALVLAIEAGCSPVSNKVRKVLESESIKKMIDFAVKKNVTRRGRGAKAHPAEAGWGRLGRDRVLLSGERSSVKLEHDSNDTERALICGPCWCSLECQGNDPTGGPRGIGPLHFISGERNSSLLIGTAPVRKRTMFNFDQKVIARY